MKSQLLQSIDEISPSEWDTLWGLSYPFTRHAFLAALEHSGSTTIESGWQPKHIVIRNADKSQSLLAALILYQKTHSYGEYVFDWAWAEAYHQHGFHYYPKLVNAIPFTPCTGSRIRFCQKLSEDQTKQAEQLLFLEIDKLLQSSCSSFHSLFPDRESIRFMEPKSLLQRKGSQFHWFNENYQSFDAFLDQFNSRKRKNINKERKKVVEQGFVFKRREGIELTADDWLGFQQLYQNTYLKRSGHAGYLNQAFFVEIGETLKEHIVLVTAHRGSHDTAVVAAALYFKSNSTLFGRYWGALEEVDYLHFEACYYQGIEYAIKHKLKRFDSGAQGEHKIPRGFTPVLTTSFHKITHPSFRRAIADFVIEEQLHNSAYCQQARASLPFKNETYIRPADYLLQESNDTEF